MQNVRESWNYKVVSANGPLVSKNGQTAGVMCTTGGTIVISSGETAGGSTIVASLTLAAGWTPLPFKYPNGAYVTVGGGFVGTFAVS